MQAISLEQLSSGTHGHGHGRSWRVVPPLLPQPAPDSTIRAPSHSIQQPAPVDGAEAMPAQAQRQQAAGVWDSSGVS